MEREAAQLQKQATRARTTTQTHICMYVYMVNNNNNKTRRKTAGETRERASEQASKRSNQKAMKRYQVKKKREVLKRKKTQCNKNKNNEKREKKWTSERTGAKEAHSAKFKVNCIYTWRSHFAVFRSLFFSFLLLFVAVVIVCFWFHFYVPDQFFPLSLSFHFISFRLISIHFFRCIFVRDYLFYCCSCSCCCCFPHQNK